MRKKYICIRSLVNIILYGGRFEYFFMNKVMKTVATYINCLHSANLCGNKNIGVSLGYRDVIIQIDWLQTCQIYHNLNGVIEDMVI